MSSNGAPTKATLLPWLSKLTSNSGVVATCMSKVKVNKELKNTDQERTLKRKKNRKKKRKRIHMNRTSKSKMIQKSSLQDKQQQRLSNYVNSSSNSLLKERMTDYISININDNMAPNIEYDEHYGSKHTSKPPSTIRFWFTNPNGIGVNWKASKSHASFAFLKNRSKADVIGLAETNVNWNMMKNSSSLYSRVKSNWKYFRTVTSNNVMDDKPTMCQRGGTCAFAVGQSAHRVISTGKDPRSLGRWTWIEFGGRDKYRSRFYCAYRPGKKPPKTKLTTVVDQHLRYIGQHDLQVTPIELFDSDLTSELEVTLANGINIVLSIDANENVETGEFSMAMNQIGMTNAFSTLFHEPMPATHHSGSQPISTFYHSSELNIVSGGILQKGCGFQADHRNMFIDIQETSFLGTAMFKVTPPPMKRLQLNDPRIYKKFQKHVQKHIEANNVDKKLLQLTKIMKHPPTNDMVDKMEQIDDQIGRAISKGLKKCRKLRVGKIPFSGLFKKLWQEKRLWTLVYKKKIGQIISATTIRRLVSSLPYRNPMSLPLKEVELLRSKAESRYQALIPHSRTERQQFFEDLACANAEISNSKKATILRRIMNTENIRDEHRRIKVFFPKKTLSKRVDKVTFVEDGNVKEATEPDDVVKQIQKDTILKYTSTSDTPLMKPNVHEEFGNFAEKEEGQNIFLGKSSIPDSFSFWTKKMLQKVQFDTSIPSIPTLLTQDEIKQVWRITKEHKASSYSGRYNAVYKAMSTSPKLLQILTLSMNIPFLAGRPYNRWKTFLDIMSFKKSNSIQVNTLRTIVISEADWNASGRILITRKMMQQAESLHLLPPEHMGGRKNKKSITGALTKRLVIDNSRLLKKPLAIISTDAANCYDRMVHKFVSLACKKWGLSQNAMIALLQPLQQARHYTRTAYGDSKKYFVGENFQGAGQGNTGAAPYWTCVSTPMIELMKEMELQSEFTTAISQRIITLALIAFVDDAELFITDLSNSPEDIMEKAERAINVWREVLEVTGGAMRPPKCAWTLVTYKKSKDPIILPISANPGDIHIPDENFVLQAVSRYEGIVARDYLGVRQRVDSSEDDQIRKMTAQVEVWNQKMSKSNLYREYNMTAVLSRINRTLQYPLPATALTFKQCHELSNKLYSSCLPKFGIVSKFLLKRRYLPYKYQGLHLPDLYLEQELGHIHELLQASVNKGICWDQFVIGIEALQIAIGSLDLPFNKKYEKLSHLVPTSWYTSLWKFCSDMGLKIKGWDSEIPLQRHQDCELMSSFANRGYSLEKLRTLNKCRLFLQVLTLSDLVPASGTSIQSHIMEGRRDKYSSSKYVWPQVNRPYLQSWKVWEEAIRDTFCVSMQSNRLKHPLGVYLDIPHGWKWYYDEKEDIVYYKDGSIFKRYIRYVKRSNTRLSYSWYQLKDVVPKDSVTSPQLASISSSADGDNLVILEGSHKCSSIPAFSTPHSNLYQVLISSPTPNWMFLHQQSQLSNISTQSLKQFFSGEILLVSDGSYKSNIGAAGIIIENQVRDERIKLTVSVPANDIMMENDSYRSEFVGVLYGIHVIQAIQDILGIRDFHIKLGCDSDSVMDVATYHNYITHKTHHRDVVSSLIAIRKMINIPMQYVKIQGHADKKKPFHELTRMEQLNVWCDKLAKFARENMTPIQSADAYFYNEGLTLWRNTQKYYSNISQHLSQAYFTSRAMEYFSEKYSFSKTQFEQFDWDALQYSMDLLQPSKRQWISKYVSRSLPIGRNMVRRTQWTHSYCPRCKDFEETHSHIIQCQHPQSQSLFRLFIASLSDWMTSQQTPDELALELLQLITEWYQYGKLLPTTYRFMGPIQKQISLGWDHFMEGRIITAFTTYMQDHYDRLKIKRTGRHWTSLLIVKIWNMLYWPQWMNRNEFVHNLNSEAIQTRKREEMELTARSLYRSETSIYLLNKDQHLLDDHLDTILDLPDAQLQAWINQFRVAVLERNRIFIPERDHNSAALRTWLQKRRVTPSKRKVGFTRYRRISPLVRELRKRSVKFKF